MREAGLGREAASTLRTEVRSAQFLHLVAVRRQHVTAQIVGVRRLETTHATRDLRHVTLLYATPPRHTSRLRRLLASECRRCRFLCHLTTESFLQGSTLMNVFDQISK